ncbi:MAG TPA: hypothetical protein VFY06_07700 [Verrucomicrobiae bacterium]|nr:hypothetical protein [Verrucomicrobiae bacterium]
MIEQELHHQETGRARRVISAESVLSYVVIGCFAVAILGILSGISGNGISLLASAAAFGVIAYIYCHKH